MSVTEKKEMLLFLVSKILVAIDSYIHASCDYM